MELKSPPVPKEESPLWKMIMKIIDIFLPFEYELKMGLPIRTAIFYPQRLLTGAFLGALVLLLFPVELTIVFLTLIKKYCNIE